MAKIPLGLAALEYLNIDEADLSDVEALADDRGGYWATCSLFLESLRDKTAAELSFKQTQWALNIVEKLEDMRRKGDL